MKRIAGFVGACIFVLCFSFPTLAADINGIIALVIGSGDIKYGAKNKVYLTTKSIQVIPVSMTTTGSPKYQDSKYKLDTVQALGDAYEKVDAEIKNNPTYIKMETMTNLQGKFKFSNVAPGEYFVVVTWPSKVGMNRVFWQVPVKVEKGDIDLELSNDNLALPTYIDR